MKQAVSTIFLHFVLFFMYVFISICFASVYLPELRRRKSRRCFFFCLNFVGGLLYSLSYVLLCFFFENSYHVHFIPTIHNTVMIYSVNTKLFITLILPLLAMVVPLSSRHQLVVPVAHLEVDALVLLMITLTSTPEVSCARHSLPS